LEKQAVRNTIIDQAKQMAPTLPTPDSSLPPPAKRARPDSTDSLLDYLEEEDLDLDASNSCTSVSDEVTRYLEDTVAPGINTLHYWEVNQEKFPRLAALALKHLCIPASSAPVERLFSVAGKIFRPDRCALQDKTFQQLIFIKGNAKFD